MLEVGWQPADIFVSAEKQAVSRPDLFAEALVLGGSIDVYVLVIDLQIPDLDKATVEHVLREFRHRQRNLSIQALFAQAADQYCDIVACHTVSLSSCQRAADIELGPTDRRLSEPTEPAFLKKRIRSGAVCQYLLRVGQASAMGRVFDPLLEFTSTTTSRPDLETRGAADGRSSPIASRPCVAGSATGNPSGQCPGIADGPATP